VKKGTSTGQGSGGEVEKATCGRKGGQSEVQREISKGAVNAEGWGAKQN